jgi:hypothetical protein
MKRILFLLTLGAILTCPSFVKAQDNSTNAPPSGPPPGGFHHDHGMGFLTDAQKQELKAARDAAFAADPSLKTEADALKASHQPGTPPSDADKANWQAFQEKLNEAMVKADPNVAPILAEIKAHHHHGGPPPPPPPSSTSSPSGT